MRGMYGSLELTPKEKRTVELVAEGLKNREIAAKLFTTVPGIRNVIREIFDKLGFGSRLELTLWHLKNTETKTHDTQKGTEARADTSQPYQ